MVVKIVQNNKYPIINLISNKFEYEDKVLQLIKRAEMFLCWSKKLYVLYEKEYKKCNGSKQKQNFIKNRGVKFLVLHNVLYFFETALILNTLLKQNKKGDEISFDNYFALNNIKALEKEIGEVRQIYLKSEIGTIRNKIIAHKDNKNTGDPIFHFMNRININLINDADKIIKKLWKIAFKNFNDPIGNNEMLDFFDDSYQFTIEAILREI